MSLPSGMADFVPRDRQLHKAYCCMWAELQSISPRLWGLSSGTPVTSLVKTDLCQYLVIDNYYVLPSLNKVSLIMEGKCKTVCDRRVLVSRAWCGWHAFAFRCDQLISMCLLKLTNQNLQEAINVAPHLFPTLQSASLRFPSESRRQLVSYENNKRFYDPIPLRLGVKDVE